MATLLAYPQPAGPAASTQFPDFNTTYGRSYATSPISQAFPRYDSPKAAFADPLPENAVAPGAIFAAQAAGGFGGSRKSTPHSSLAGLKRRSSSRARTDAATSSMADSARSPESQGPTAKERLKSNLKKVKQQKVDTSNTLDLSMTAEENEKRTGIQIYSQDRAIRSVADVHFKPLSRRRHNTFGHQAEYGSYQPSKPFTIAPQPPRSETSRSAYHSHANSTVNSEYSVDPFEGSRRPSVMDSGRPSLRLNTTSEATSVPSVTRPRRGTNQSSVSAGTPGSRSRKSLDKAMRALGRRDSTATADDMMDPVARVASIQAARQAFDARQEEKDAKYEAMAAKDRERQERKAQRKSEGRSRAGSHVPATASTQHLSEKVGEPVEGPEYAALPVPPLHSRPMMGARKLSERPPMSRKRNVKNRYAWFLSWLKTKFLNLARRRRKD